MTIETEPFKPHANWRPKRTTAEHIEIHKEKVFADADAKTVNRINNQLDNLYPKAGFKVSKAEYLAARKEAEAYIKEQVGPNGNPDRRYDRDASLSWYPVECKGKVRVELKSDKDSHGKVEASSFQFQGDYSKAEQLTKKWVDFNAGNALKRHCEKEGRAFIENEAKTLETYCKLVPESQRSHKANDVVKVAEKGQRQAVMDFRSAPRGHLWKESDVPFQQKSSTAVQR